MKVILAPQRGVALALLLWMLAALSLMVAGLMSLSRSDVQLTTLQLDQARAQAAAIGIAHVALGEMHALSLAGEFDANVGLHRQYELAGLPLGVSILPASALVNINSAELPLLETLLRHAGGQDDASAAELAAAIVDWRSGIFTDAGDSTLTDTGRGAFRVEEELLEVPGMSRDIYEKIRGLIHSQQEAGSELNLLAAPELLLNAWRSVDAAAVDFALESRQDVARDGPAPAGPALPPALAGAGIYCVEVDITVSENRVFRQRIWVDMQGGNGLPWRFTRIYPLTTRQSNSEEAQFAI